MNPGDMQYSRYFVWMTAGFIAVAFIPVVYAWWHQTPVEEIR